MPRSWTPKQERQYEHIKEGYQKKGTATKTAESRAAATVNKQKSERKGTKKK